MKKLFLSLILLAAFITAHAGNYPFEVKISGSGTKNLVFIPGFGCSGEVWNETVKKFEGGYKCYVLTMPGFAGVAPQAAPDVKSWVNAIADYIEKEKLDKPIVIGHSLGGIMAQWLAADHPASAGKIVVVDALPCLPAFSNPAFKANDAPDCSSFTTAYMQMSDQQFTQMQRRSVASLVADTSMINTITQWNIKSDKNTLGLVFCQLMNTDLREKISAVSCPSLVLLEANFKGMSDAVSEQYKNMKNARLVYATKGLHFIMYDDKDWYFQQLESFLQQAQ